jgi:beta propeller repeat protein
MTRGTARTLTRPRWPLVALAVLVVAATLGATAAATPASAAPRPFVVCNQFGGQAGPDIAQDVAVWTDNRNGNLDIYGKDLKTGRQYAVCTDPEQQDNPSISTTVSKSGKVHYIVIWSDKRNHAGGDANDIYGRDITARRNFVVSRNAYVKQYPDISGDWVVWIESDDPAGPFRIRAFDRVAGKTYLIATSKVLSPPAVDWRELRSGKIVYTAVYASSTGDISARNLPDGDPFLISQAKRFEWMPDISHNRVVWWQSGERILYRDLKKDRTSFVHKGSRPRIDGELVTWDGGGHGGEFVISYVPGARIFVRNVVRRAGVVEFGVAKQTNLFPSISGHRVVWEAGPARRVLSHIHIYGARVR